MLRTPDSVAAATANKAPAVVTKSRAPSFQPNQSTASGYQQIEGIDCSPCTTGPSRSLSVRERAMARPSSRPPTADRAKPSPMRFSVCVRATASSRLVSSRHRVRATSSGQGNTYRGQRPVQHRACHATSSSPAEIRPAFHLAIPQLLLQRRLHVAAQVAHEEGADLQEVRVVGFAGARVLDRHLAPDAAWPEGKHGKCRSPRRIASETLCVTKMMVCPSLPRCAAAPRA